MSFPRAAKYALSLLAIAFLALRFVHLSADYPRNISWDDGVATDEGWYSSSALNQQTWHTSMLPGDMNISVLMPIWPCIVEAAFRLCGFSIWTLRSTTVLFFFLCLLLLCKLLFRYGAGKWVPLFAAMLAVNPWSFALSRIGFLEFPMLSFFLLATILAANRMEEDGLDGSPSATFRLMLGGIVFALAVLLKTTAIALAPVLIYVIAQQTDFRIGRSLRNAGTLFFGSAIVGIPYWAFYVRRHMDDVSFYLIGVKSALRFTLYGFIADASRPFRYGLGSDHLLFALALAVICASIFWRKLRTLWKDPLFALSALWLISFLGFMVKHNYDPVRYYAVTIPPTMLLAVALLRKMQFTNPRPYKILLSLIVADIALNAWQVSAAMMRPTYSFRNASIAIGDIVRQDSSRNDVAIGGNMPEISLLNGLKPVNLLFHSDSITQQMERYRPGWWVQGEDDGSCFRDVLSPAYSAERRGQWEIFYPGKTLTLWKLNKVPNVPLPVELTPAQTAACLPAVEDLSKLPSNPSKIQLFARKLKLLK
jgi:hypothetical protein